MDNLLIKPRESNVTVKKAIHHELQRARELGPLPGPVCCSGCPEYDPARGCDRNCPFAPSRLSSEAEKYPLETLIAPLVFELKKLGVFLPCWSCEGHNDANGALWKIPRVWFYSDSVVHLRVLDNAVNALFLNQRISIPWGVALIFSHPENLDTTFSLEPKVYEKKSYLADLQSDLKIITENLTGLFYQTCDDLRRQAC
jgi:hypothetical protein